MLEATKAGYFTLLFNDDGKFINEPWTPVS